MISNNLAFKFSSVDGSSFGVKLPYVPKDIAELLAMYLVMYWFAYREIVLNMNPVKLLTVAFKTLSTLSTSLNTRVPYLLSSRIFKGIYCDSVGVTSGITNIPE